MSKERIRTSPDIKNITTELISSNRSTQVGYREPHSGQTTERQQATILKKTTLFRPLFNLYYGKFRVPLKQFSEILT